MCPNADFEERHRVDSLVRSLTLPSWPFSGPGEMTHEHFCQIFRAKGSSRTNPTREFRGTFEISTRHQIFFPLSQPMYARFVL